MDDKRADKFLYILWMPLLQCRYVTCRIPGDFRGKNYSVIYENSKIKFEIKSEYLNCALNEF